MEIRLIHYAVKKIVLVLAVAFFFINCSKDAPKDLVVAQEEMEEIDPEEGKVNQAPNAFNLLSIENNTQDATVLPNLEWQVAIDPDTDAVVYDVYLDTVNPPTTIYDEDISANSIQITSRLRLLEDYFWKVTAKDNKGASTESTLFNFTTRNLDIPEMATVAAGPFSERRQAAGSFFDDKMWVIGGLDEDANYLNDVWHSEDGTDWLPANSTAEFSGRWDHTLTSFDNRLWLIGGYDGDDYLNDVWYSENGVDWSEVDLTSTFPSRGRHTTLEYDNKLWVIGGYNGSSLSDVWYSENGTEWVLATDEAAFGSRSLHASVVFDNKLWVIAGLANGTRENDTWYSENGTEWILANQSNMFSPRIRHSAVVYDDKIWVMGGSNPGTLDDIWYSKNGIDWIAILDEHPFPERSDHTSLVFDDKIWLVCGYDGDSYNDVWAFD